MEYSIHELSQLSGVTARTLRWYDKIGLLRPSRTAESGYRYYGSEEVTRLQDILFFRALGVELSQIRARLDAPDFDRLAALRTHLSALETEQARLERLIRSVQATINAEERSIIMRDEEKFEAFKAKLVADNEATYGKEVREKYGDTTVDAANQAFMGLTQAQHEEWTELERRILSGLEAAVQAGILPESDEGRTLVLLHKRWLTIAMGSYEVNRHKGIAMMYAADERFVAYYDRTAAGCARFLCNSVQYWADRL